jgi:hypothetical protein
VTEGVDPTVIAAFAVGVVSFISPCVLPLVPGYLSAVSGLSLAEMQSGERNLLKILLPAIVFCLSFTTVFVALGMTASGLGASLQDHREMLDGGDDSHAGDHHAAQVGAKASRYVCHGAGATPDALVVTTIKTSGRSLGSQPDHSNFQV